MHFRSLVVLFAVTTGCAASASDPAPETAPASSTAISPADSIVEHGAVASGETESVAYERYADRKSIPYFGIALSPAEGEGLQAVTVTGPFPGAPEAVVVDENYNELARATGNADPNGAASVTVHAPRVANRIVLVRDGLWSRPMTFQVTAGK